MLVVRSTKVPRAVFDAADRLVLVIRAGAGTNTIDTDAAAEHGVPVEFLWAARGLFDEPQGLSLIHI